MYGLKHFINCINNQSNNGNIVKIARIKNMFRTKLIDNVSKKYNYCDIKINVIIEYNNICLIGEVQFLLKFMLKVKTMGHSLYNVKRRKDFMNQVNTITDALYNDESKNKKESKLTQRIVAAIQKQDGVSLGNELLFYADKALQVKRIPMVIGGTTDPKDPMAGAPIPILHFCSFNRWLRGVKLIVATAFHVDKTKGGFAKKCMYGCINICICACVCIFMFFGFENV